MPRQSMSAGFDAVKSRLGNRSSVRDIECVEISLEREDC